MIYIYDILLNFNENLIEFFEWMDEDDIKYIKKIPLFKVDKNTINNFINKKIKIDEEFLYLIKDKCDFYDEPLTKEDTYLTLITDSNIVIGLQIINKEITKVSRLLLEEEYEILNASEKMIYSNINYQIIDNKKLITNNLTRYENNIKQSLIKEINNLKENNKEEKLKFYYYEYFNKVCNDINNIYHVLINDIRNNFSNKHINLYNLMKLSYQNK